MVALQRVTIAAVAGVAVIIQQVLNADLRYALSPATAAKARK